MNLEGTLTLPKVRRGEPDVSLLFLLSLLPAALFRCHQLKEDTEFREFLSVHQKRIQTATWANDALDAEPSKGKSKPANDYLNFDSDSGQESEEEGAGEDLEGEVIHPHVCASCQRACPCVCPGLCVCDMGPLSARQGQWASLVGAVIPTAVTVALTDSGHLLIQSVSHSTIEPLWHARHCFRH